QKHAKPPSSRRWPVGAASASGIMPCRTESAPENGHLRALKRRGSDIACQTRSGTGASPTWARTRDLRMTERALAEEEPPQVQDLKRIFFSGWGLPSRPNLSRTRMAEPQVRDRENPNKKARSSSRTTS